MIYHLIQRKLLVVYDFEIVINDFEYYIEYYILSLNIPPKMINEIHMFYSLFAVEKL